MGRIARHDPTRANVVPLSIFAHGWHDNGAARRGMARDTVDGMTEADYKQARREMEVSERFKTNAQTLADITEEEDEAFLATVYEETGTIAPGRHTKTREYARNYYHNVYKHKMKERKQQELFEEDDND